MPKETAGESPTMGNIAFKTTVQDKTALRVMCAELRHSQQDVMAALVHMIVTEYGRDPKVVRELLETAGRP